MIESLVSVVCGTVPAFLIRTCMHESAKHVEN